MTCKLIGAVGIALAGCASNPYPGTPEDLPRRVEESEAGTTIEMARGKRVTLRLEANHSTGHRWFLAASGDAGLERGKRSCASSTGALGSGQATG